MNQKEIKELRRRFKPDKENFSSIFGCYVNEKREIISRFEEPLTGPAQGSAEYFLSLIKRTLSGTLGKNLLDIAFSNQQVIDSDEHRLLSMLRGTALQDAEVLDTFYQRVIGALQLEGNYLILLAHDVYSVPYRSTDGSLQGDNSDEEYSYIVCCICPVKATQPSLRYDSQENRFRAGNQGWIVAPPELGFLFPAFDDRATNLYNALYYTHSASDAHPEFIDAVFRTEAPMPAAAQKETFQAVLSESLHEECSLNVVQSMHEQLVTAIEAQKESGEGEPLLLTGRDLGAVLESCGVSEERVSDFSTQFEAHFGADAALPPANVIDSRHFEVRMPDVVIKVDPARRDLIETRVLDGSRYLLIRADAEVEVNGVTVNLKGEV